MSKYRINTLINGYIVADVIFRFERYLQRFEIQHASTIHPRDDQIRHLFEIQRADAIERGAVPDGPGVERGQRRLWRHPEESDRDNQYTDASRFQTVPAEEIQV